MHTHEPYQKPNNSPSYLNIQSQNRKLSRRIIYFNSPFSKIVKTNGIKLFLTLLDEQFPKSHKLFKCFNRNNMKATYCTLTNMKVEIGIHMPKFLIVKIQKKKILSAIAVIKMLVRYRESATRKTLFIKPK